MNSNHIYIINGRRYTKHQLNAMRNARIQREEHRRKAKRRAELLEKLRLSVLVILLLVLATFVVCICARLSWDSEFQKTLGVNILRVLALALLAWAYINHELKAEAKARAKAKARKKSQPQRRHAA